MDFKDTWDLESAIAVVQNQTVDSKLWAEAVEWLLLHGPPEISELVLRASGQATEHCFPELAEADYTSDGQPVYDLGKLAAVLDISEEEARRILARKTARNRPGGWHGGGSGMTH